MTGNSVYTSLPALVIGFHGCDKSVAHDAVCKNVPLSASKNRYDWLGHGVYFWKQDPSRALSYAQELSANPARNRGGIKEPAVVGAVIDLGHCLDLTRREDVEQVQRAYYILADIYSELGEKLPVNSPVPEMGNDLLLRNLDCEVLQILHTENPGRQFDTVTSPFFEGPDLYPNAGFKAKNHIQICVRNPNCIKGYFLPRNPDKEHPVP